jgi:hypothetical protein
MLIFYCVSDVRELSGWRPLTSATEPYVRLSDVICGNVSHESSSRGGGERVL